jgi:hypothetical protein
VFLQNGSNNGRQRVVCKGFLLIREFPVFNTVFILMKPLGPSEIVLRSDVESPHTLPATIHKFLSAYDSVVSIFMSDLWSCIVIRYEAISQPIFNGSTQTVNTPYFVSSILTRRAKFRLLTSITLTAQAHGVQGWCAFLLGSLAYFSRLHVHLYS